MRLLLTAIFLITTPAWAQDDYEPRIPKGGYMSRPNWAWQIDSNWEPLENSRNGPSFLLIKGDPYGKITFSCFDLFDNRPMVKFKFRHNSVHHGAIWHPEERVHFELGFLTQSGAALKTETTRYDWPNKSPRMQVVREESFHKVSFVYEEAINLMRRIYHSESMTFADRRTGEINTVATGDKARKGLLQFTQACGINLGVASPEEETDDLR